MPVTTETATVYRGGGRRWFTLQAACNAEAKSLHRKRFDQQCYCSSPEPEVGDGGDTCEFHEDKFFHRFVRRVAWLIRQQHTGGQRP